VIKKITLLFLNLKLNNLNKMAYESFDNINQHELQAVIEAEMNLFENTRSTNTYTNMEARLKVRKSQRVQTLREHVAVESPILSMPMATKLDQRKKIKKLVKNKRNQNNNLAKNFLCTNFNLIRQNNLNI
jgi:hypothetical protein